MKKYFIFLFILVSFIFSSQTFAEVPGKSGFIPGQIWYSKDTLTEGDTVNIHTAVWNSEKNSLSAKVEFYDKNVILGTRDIVLASSELKDVYVPWKITSGDHIISAKIISSTMTTSGKNEKIVLNKVLTSSDKQSVSAVSKNDDSTKASEGDSLKTEIDKVNSNINNIIPASVSSIVSDNFSILDSFRDQTSLEINTTKNETQKEIDSIDSSKKEVKPLSKTVYQKNNIEDMVQKPIAYIKLFLFSVLSFIFSNKIIFYGVLTLVLFYIIRFIYRKIRNR